MNKYLTQSEHMSREYCCSIVKIGELLPIEGSDFLAKTLVDGFQIVVRKDQVKTGDIMFYAELETRLSEKFLSVNNLFEMSCYEKNSNANEVTKILESSLTEKERQEKLNHMHGFFNKHGRVKMVTLRKCPSMGYLFSIEEMINYCPKIKGFNFEEYFKSEETDRDFDTVDGELFVKAYVPPVKTSPEKSSRTKKASKRLERFDRLVENQFAFHYDTQQLNKNIWKFKPDTAVDISVKKHGTSAIFSNCLVKQPKAFKSKILTWINSKVLPTKFRVMEEVYDNIYSSRTVIKNQYINETVSSGFYKTDIWGEYNDLLKGKIPEGYTIYGEIVGYLTDSETMIQKEYDYGCKSGENKLMIYRVTQNKDSNIEEFEISDVINFTENLISRYPELKEKIEPMTMLYSGTLRNLFPGIPVDEDWENNVLDCLKTCKLFNMEGKEDLCTHFNVPREGIVVRIQNDPLKEAFKLKCVKFLNRESKLVDSGEVDMEMFASYSSEREEG